MRRLIAFAGVVGLACASMQAPPGGAKRTVPPALLSVTPESGAVNVKDKVVAFSFDAIVDDRVGRGGSLAGSFLVSPSEGAVVSWHRDRVDVRPKGGFKPNTAYSVTMLPGISDLSRNVMKETRTVTFSTGAEIPPYAVHGRIFDWMAERVAGDARIDVIRLPDSLPYMGVSDSTGQFAVGPLAAGTYAVRGLIDNNHNGLRDLNETWDTATVTITAESPFIELRAAARDSIGPRLLTVTSTDSLTLIISFDKPIDPTVALYPKFRLQAADSSELTVLAIRTQARHRAIQDSVRRDSLAKADTSAAGRAARDTPQAEMPAVAVGTPPKPSLPAPPRELVLLVAQAQPLRPGAYRITATDARSIAGVTRTSERSFTVTPRDTSRAPSKP